MTDRAQKTFRLLAWIATILGCFLVTGTFWADILNPLIFDATGERRMDGIFPILSPLLLQINVALHFGWSKGLPLLFVGAAGLAFSYARKSARFDAVRSRPFTSAALAVSLLAHVIVFAVSAQFFFVPAGSHIRPMGWAMFIAIVSFMCFVVVEPVSIIAIVKERPRALGIVGLVGGLTAFFFGSFLLHFAAWVKGFELSP